MAGRLSRAASPCGLAASAGPRRRTSGLCPRAALLSVLSAALGAALLALRSAGQGTAWAPAPRSRVRQPRAARRAGQEAQPPRRCPGCGKAQRSDCDGAGRLIGGVGSVAEWVPVKAYRKCPKFQGKYKRLGQKTGTFFDEGGAKMESEELLLVPATWRSLTRIRLREFADVKAQPTGDFVGPYEKFEVVDVIRRDGQHFLQLKEKSGWAFDRGIAGAWAGKPICERVDGPTM